MNESIVWDNETIFVLIVIAIVLILSGAFVVKVFGYDHEIEKIALLVKDNRLRVSLKLCLWMLYILVYGLVAVFIIIFFQGSDQKNRNI